MDVNTAWLNALLEDSVLVKTTHGFYHSVSKWRSLKSLKVLYGLKKAPKLWNQLPDWFRNEIRPEGKSADRSLYTRTKNGDLEVEKIVYVEDILIKENSSHMQKRLQKDTT